MAQTRPRRTRGFTLVELLVALFVLSLVAVLSWRGLDGMVRTQSQVQARADEVMTLQVGLAQWRTDLDAVVSQPGLPEIEWNGQVLRMLRRSDSAAGRRTSITPAMPSRTCQFSRQIASGDDLPTSSTR